jgi:hypothetical protein
MNTTTQSIAARARKFYAVQSPFHPALESKSITAYSALEAKREYAAKFGIKISECRAILELY